MDIKVLKTIKNNFLKELIAANSGKKTSLPYIIHELSTQKIVEDGEIFQVIVTGGTVCKEAKVEYKKGKIRILRKQEMPCGQFNTKEDFLKFILKNLDINTHTLALNFTFPMTPFLEDNKLGGILIAGAKEHKFHGLIGKKVGSEVEKYIFSKTGRKLKVALANDTICLLLSALTLYSFDQITAGIVGTGLNFAIFIDKKRAINLEAANFNKFPISSEAQAIDRKSAFPGAGLFEKETAGAYLYKQFNLKIKNQKINFREINSTAELSSVANKQSFSTNRNLRTVSQIARSLLEKSAALVACQIAGIAEFKKSDQIFVMEGSLFWFNLENQIGSYLIKLIPQYKIKFVKIENSEILGAAKLVS